MQPQARYSLPSWSVCGLTLPAVHIFGLSHRSCHLIAAVMAGTLFLYASSPLLCSTSLASTSAAATSLSLDDVE